MTAGSAQIEFNAGGSRLFGYANSLAFHTGGGLGSTANEMMRMTATGLGIGTTTPGSKLSISGGASIGANYGVAAPTNGLIVQGNVGIGKTGPGTALDVTGVITVTGSTGGASVGNGNTLTGINAVTLGISNSANASNGVAVGKGNTSGGGNNAAVGFNNTAADSFASAFGYNNTANNSNSNAFGGSNTVSAIGASAFGNSITNTIANSVMMGPSNTAKLTINSSGNVGIGTTTPGYKLSVIGGGGANDYTGQFVSALNSTALSLQNTGTGGLNWSAASVGNVSGRQGNFEIGRPGVSIPFIINSSGNVGIGTTTSSEKLSVYGNLLLTATGRIYMPNTAAIYSRNAANTFYAPIFALDASNQLNIGETTSSLATPLRFFTSGSATPNVTINTLGNMGLGTTTPGSRLSISGGASIGANYGVAAPTNGLIVEGTVGIGTKSPTIGKLQIDAGGTGPQIATFFNNTDTAPGTSEVRTVFGQGGSWYQGISGAYNTGAPYMGFSVNTVGATWAEKMRIDSTGKVGIGVNDPDSTLELFNTANQFKVSYDGTNFTALTVSSGGDLTINPSGGDVLLDTENFSVCNGACGSTPNGTGNVTVEGSIVSEEYTLGTTGAITVNWDQGNQQRVNSSTGNMTFDFSNATAGQTIRLVVCYGGVHTITWTPTIKWAGGTAPTPTSTNTKCDVFSFLYTGTAYFGQPSLNF